jgi:hypothetical protein
MHGFELRGIDMPLIWNPQVSVPWLLLVPQISNLALPSVMSGGNPN